MPPYEDVLTDNGQQIRLSEITAIVTDANLTEDEKKAELRKLGIEDEDLIDLLIRNLA